MFVWPQISPPHLNIPAEEGCPQILRTLPSSPYLTSSPLRAKFAFFGHPDKASSTLIITINITTILFCRLTEDGGRLTKEVVVGERGR